MAPANAEWLIARNPASGAEIGRVQVTPVNMVTDAVARARLAQANWCRTTWSERNDVLRRWWTILARDAEIWADRIRAEIGKPRIEALAGDVVPALDAIRWTVKYAGRTLADERIGPGWQRFLLMPAGRLQWQPFGVVGMLGTWNFPLLLNAPPIAQALAMGNAVVWKPSEYASLSGLRLQESLEEAGIPAGLVSAVFGGPEVGRALVDADLDKGMFTGGIENGRRVVGELASRGIPALAELSGFDAAVVLADAPIESTVRSLTWAAFVGCGQACVAVKRVLIVGNATPWARAIAARANTLRVGDPETSSVDLGPMISAAARDRFHRMVQESAAAGAHVLCGGTPSPGPGSFYPPTVLLSETADAELPLAGAFGPVVLVRGVATPDEAVAAANASPFGLAASVWGRDRRAAMRVARRLEAGMVAVNDAVTPGAHAAAPFGGIKASGFGRTKGVLGLREFAQPQILHTKRPGGFRPQLFPYGGILERLLATYRRLFHPHG